ncbi:hypothetical protein DLAC_11304 [Tieghemostelium lacteum]|uniref:Decapping nuclease n=1 Tax=Tieghemostelium lacteum TaxID=361077 RepID=A0A151Z3P3_TIELA|nr:hypothetical protein DLAC_11304 [Tieghemostelium lacteum]|eukprot:KYQ88571.1 hypothetical protein DLAC_11304 [Tieghemostelium lacteum]
MNKINTLNVNLIRNTIRKNNTKTTISQPTEIFSYCYDNNGNVYQAKLNKFKSVPINSNLIEGFEVSKVKFETSSSLKCVLDTLIKNQFNSSKVNFVTYRNNLNKIFGSFMSNDKWEMDIEKIDETIYLGVILDQEPPSSDNELHYKSIYAGYKFEDLSRQIDSPYQYCSISRTKLLKNEIILASEIDCYKQKENLKDGVYNMDDYVELKTCKEIVDHKGAFVYKKFKLFKFWLQSYLAGVRKIVVAMHSDFVIKSVKELNTLEIPSLTKDIWKPDHCLLHGNEILEFIKTNTQPNHKYLLQFNHPDINLYQLSPEQPQNQPSILTNEYLQYLKDQTSNNVNNNDKKRKLEEDLVSNDNIKREKLTGQEH